MLHALEPNRRTSSDVPAGGSGTMPLNDPASPEAQRFMASVVESSGDAIIGSTADSGLIVSWNRGAECLFGYPAEEIIGKPVAALIPENERHTLRGSQEKLLRGEAIPWFEAKVLTRLGETVDVSVSVSPIRDSDGRVTWFAAAMRDITAHKRAEEASHFLASIVESCDDAIIGANLKGVIVSWNRGAQNIFGYSAEEMIGRHVSVLTPPDRAAENASFLEAVRHGQSVEHHETVRLRKDGTPVDVSITVSPIRGANGAILGVAGVCRDITSHVRAETALRKSEKRFRRLFEQSLAGVIRTTIDGAILDCNPAWAEMFGYSMSDRPTAGEFYVDPAERVALLERLKKEKIVKNVELRFWRKDGQQIWVLANFALEDSGRIDGTLIEITDRKRAEQEMARAAQAAEAASRAKSDFLANMSHEIRTPMNGVLGMADVLLQTELTEEQRDCLDTIRQSGQALLGIINDILDFSKIEAGKLSLYNTEFDLRRSVDEILKLMSVTAVQKGLRIVSDVAPEVPRAIEADEMRVRQVLLNLIGNAIKFTARGEIRLRVQVEDSGRGLHFEVRDTGIGIPRDKQDIIFDAFAQADGSFNRKFGGTGLGLAICARLVSMMGGRIWVESEERRGAAFHFTIPLETRDKTSGGLFRGNR